MTKDEIMHVLRLVALGRINTPEQVAFCEKLERAFAGEGSHCTMPGGEHMRGCDNNPLPYELQDVIGACITVDGEVVAVRASELPAKRTRKTKAE